MTAKEAVNWIINIMADIGKSEHRALWHYEQALMEIREMLEASAQQWIPCSERLPEYGTPVLWSNEHGSVFISAITAMTDHSWAVGKRHRQSKVIAWMPLPEPYKEGREV